MRTHLHGTDRSQSNPSFLFCIAVLPTSGTSSFQISLKNLWFLLILLFFSFVELETKAQTPLKNGGQTLRGTGLPWSAPLAHTEQKQSCRKSGHETESLALQSLNHLCPVTTFHMITLLTCCLRQNPNMSSWSLDSSNDLADLPHP